MIRKLVGRLNESLRDYLSSPSSVRRKICVPVTISIESEAKNLRRLDTGKLLAGEDAAILSIKGETRDLSENGFEFIVPSVRLGQNYLVGQESKTLNVMLDLPGGKVCFQAVGQRYEPIGEAASATKYLIGAEITKMSAADRRAYAAYLEQERKAQKSENKGLSFGITNN